ncbi:MAG: hypothetical protein Q7K43_04160 [Candidatus Woesearchaeota archaeon]|nr:hypothetical protein [Candidatus Woesearchaeota archaeon]
MDFTQEEIVYSEKALRILSAQARMNGLESPLLVLLPIEGIVPKYVIDGEQLVLSWPACLSDCAESFGNTRIYFEQMRYFL